MTTPVPAAPLGWPSGFLAEESAVGWPGPATPTRPDVSRETPAQLAPAARAIVADRHAVSETAAASESDAAHESAPERPDSPMAEPSSGRGRSVGPSGDPASDDGAASDFETGPSASGTAEPEHAAPERAEPGPLGPGRLGPARAAAPLVPAATDPYPSGVSRETTTEDRADRADSPWPRPAAPKTYVVANQKGGVGKTTTAVNLSAALAQHGARVLVIDLDPQGNASTAFSIDHREGTPSIYDVLVKGAKIEDVAVAAEALPNLQCVPATIDLAGAEIELVSVVARETRLRKALAAIEVPYDYVFIDCPPSLGLLTINALVAGRDVLIPIQCEFYALEGLTQLLRNIELVRAHLNEELQVSTILLTMYDGRTRLAEQVAAEVRGHFGDLVLTATVPRSVRISEAPGFGQSIMTYDPASRGARAYADAAYELAVRASRAHGDDLQGEGERR